MRKGLYIAIIIKKLYEKREKTKLIMDEVIIYE